MTTRKWSARFELTPASLLAALAAACRQNPGAYILEKERQLAELGYENVHIEVEALIQIEGLEHFSSIFFGLVPLKLHRLRVFDSRFGIRLRYQGMRFDDIEELRLAPPILGSCEISIHGPGFGTAARFDGEMFIGPPIAEPHGAELLICTSNFIMRLTPLALKFKCLGSIDDMEHSLEGWAELLLALSLSWRRSKRP